MTRTPRYRYKIRKITSSNKSGDCYGVTVPQIIAKQFDGVNFYLVVSDTSLIFQSGCLLERKEVMNG